MVPMVARATQEVLALVRGALREASLALGVSRVANRLRRRAPDRARRHRHGHRARRRARRRRDGAAPLHLVDHGERDQHGRAPRRCRRSRSRSSPTPSRRPGRAGARVDGGARPDHASCSSRASSPARSPARSRDASSPAAISGAIRRALMGESPRLPAPRRERRPGDRSRRARRRSASPAGSRVDELHHAHRPRPAHGIVMHPGDARMFPATPQRTAREPPRGAGAHARSPRSRGSSRREAEVRGRPEDRRAGRLRGEALRRVELRDPRAERLDDPPAARVRARAPSRARR